MKAPKAQHTAKQDDVFPSVAHAARYVGLSRPTFTQHVLPQIPHRRVGRRVLISRAALVKWLESEKGGVN